MDTTTADSQTESGVRALLDRWVEASRSKDLEAVMACYSPDVRAFDAIGRLQFEGAEAYGKHWKTCFTYMPGEMIYEIHHLEIAVGGDVAFCHYLARCGMTDDKGEEQSGWLRATVCCRRLDNRWQILHEHYSVPFDPISNKALVELQPESPPQDSAV